MNTSEIEFKSLSAVNDDLEVGNNEGSHEGKRSVVYTPIAPENAPAVLSFSNIIVTKRGSNKKVLLNKICGSITGGMWAIMGTNLCALVTLLNSHFVTYFSFLLRFLWKWKDYSSEYPFLET